jgi:signal transduction histidine kinase
LRDELELMMVQLLDNALKFNRSSRPHIVISAVEESDAVTIKVQDNGIGIPVANRNEVFDLFRRLHPRTEFRGSGIGLTMVARIAALHGGNCWVENSRLGGCCICVRLPK